MKNKSDIWKAIKIRKSIVSEMKILKSLKERPKSKKDIAWEGTCSMSYVINTINKFLKTKLVKICEKRHSARFGPEEKVYSLTFKGRIAVRYAEGLINILEDKTCL